MPPAIWDINDKPLDFGGILFLLDPFFTGVGNCPILGILDITLVAIIHHIPNGWVMFNGDI